MKTISPSQRNKSYRPNRVDDLAILPVFFKLKGKEALIANGSDAACWKAEVLAAAGAIVHIYAPDLSDDFEELLAGKNAARFVWHKSKWNARSFERKSIAIIDAVDDDEASVFYNAARTAGVPVNVIDNPPYCEFQFGSIVNRSPVVISISTDGAAPILGQAIRRRIETLLPKSMALWAQAAADIRGYVNATRKMGAPRKAYWNAFVDLAFGRTKPADTNLKTLGLNDNKQGRVTLVGAGPGQEELLTLKAVRALQSADIILFDEFISNSILELARREAKRMMIKNSDNPINKPMIQLAKSGKHIVRLQAGDPSLVAASNQRFLALQQQGIATEIIPGITAQSAEAADILNQANKAAADCLQVKPVTALAAGR